MGLRQEARVLEGRYAPIIEAADRALSRRDFADAIATAGTVMKILAKDQVTPPNPPRTLEEISKHDPKNPLGGFETPMARERYMHALEIITEASASMLRYQPA